jgi:type IV pilus assembly protein PilA
MLDTLRKRLRSEKGFTLIELLVVMIILAILTAIAIPSYLSFKDRANNSAAGADVRSIIPSIESYFSDNGTYAGMSVAGLQASYDQAINLSTYTLGAGTQTDTSYCIQASSQNKTASKPGPSSQIVIGGTCP